MRTIEREIVGAFVFSADDCLLLGQSIEGGVYKDTWLVPGGGIEEDETKLQAVQRELEEETGLRADSSSITVLEGQHTGQSKKTLRETGEQVLVSMIFWDYKVSLSKSSDEIQISASDDLKEVRWFRERELARLTLAPGTKARLQKMGII